MCPDSMSFFCSWQALVCLIGSDENNPLLQAVSTICRAQGTSKRVAVTVRKRKHLSQCTTCSLFGVLGRYKTDLTREKEQLDSRLSLGKIQNAVNDLFLIL